MQTLFSDPGGIQTPNLLIRSQMHYSVMLRGHLRLQKYTFFLKNHSDFSILFKKTLSQAIKVL